ncbi:site-specific integrase [Pigmentibacter sp. JX0631]|uniref:tyrosine-type recombinase/integrase n=1 Tax=Pigmentibacter sp. JX0631 TaxID=2976982 RepID=UPI002469411F|nr:site-specific integrase [Pigmentibacter sp. JX0631]WGL60524.1 site-specific integrase [Pigmentibacter sp. JX0631]
MHQSTNRLAGIRFLQRINKWEARVSVQGEHYSKTFIKQEDAIHWRELMLKPSVNLVPTCETLFPQWLENPFGAYSPQTLFIYEQNVRLYLDKAFGHLKPEEITEQAILTFVLNLASSTTNQGKKRSLKSIKNIVGCFSSFLDWCCFKSYLEDNPLKRSKVKNNLSIFYKKNRLENNQANTIKKKALTKEEAKLLIAQAYKRGLQTGLIIEFLIYTGLRIGEAAALTWGDLNYLKTDNLGTVSLFITIDKTMNHRTKSIQRSAKCGSNGQVEISYSIALKLEQWKKIASEYGYPISSLDFLFPFVAQSPKDFSALISSLARKANIKHVTAHGLRHTTITFLASSGHSMQVVQKIARHKTSDMTTAYFDATQLPVTGVTASIEGILG